MKRFKVTALLVALLGTATVTGSHAQGPYSATEVMFAQMMIPHHQQAILISQWELKQGSNAAAKKLAARIIAEQGPEINQMKTWIPANAMSGMDMPMQGIVSDADLKVMQSAMGKKMDGLYLVNMTRHHQGAIAMANSLMQSKNPEVATLAKKIVLGQSKEIVEMRRIMMTGK